MKGSLRMEADASCVRDAVHSILKRHRDDESVARRIFSVGDGQLAAEAKVLKGQEASWITPVQALAILNVVGTTPGVAFHNSGTIRDFVARSLAGAWPQNADELVEMLLRQPGRIRHVLKEMPADLFSHPGVTGPVLAMLTSGPSVMSETLELARMLTFDEGQIRALLHHHLGGRGSGRRFASEPGPLAGLIPVVLPRSDASASWQRIQQACIKRSMPDAETSDDLVRCLDCLPMRWRGTDPTFDLLGSTPEVREAWVARIVKFLEEDGTLLDALLEGLLWHGAEYADDLVMTVAAAVCDATPDDGRSALGRLAAHPSQGVVLRVDALRRRIADVPAEPDRPMPSGILDATRRISDLSDRYRGSPATWIGDRRIETTIENAVRDAAARFVGSYEAHWREDEEPLTVKLLSDVRNALAQVERDVAALAGRGPAVRRISFSLRDRIVPKSEEGAEGIIPGSEFAADVCFIMTARRDGKVLANRATLVQVKKLKMGANGRWRPSFEIVRAQLKAISVQTASSFYMLLGPEEGGRSIPVIPARLVADHLRRGGRTRRLHRDDVSRASRALATWLTYDLIGLWCGDPDVLVLQKAAGENGRKPYILIELDVTITFDKGE